MDQLPHDDGGPAFPYDLAMLTDSGNGPIRTAVDAHAGISLADLIAALVVPHVAGNVRARAKESYEVADALIEQKRARDRRISAYYTKRAEEQRAAEEQARTEKVEAMRKPSGA